MIRLFMFLLLSTGTFAAAGSAPEPYLPRVSEPRPVNTAIRSDQVSFQLPGGSAIAPLTIRRSLDGEWKFSGLESSASPFALGEKKTWGDCDFDDSSWQKVEVPKSFYAYRDQNQKLYYDTFVKTKPYYRGGYRSTLTLSPEDIAVGRVLLRFGAVGYEANLYVNGQPAGHHHGDFCPFEADITSFVKPGANVLALEVLSDFGNKVGNINAISHVYGSQFSKYSIKGGLWQSVELILTADPYIARLLVNPRLASKTVELDYTIINFRRQPISVRLGAAVTDAMKDNANRITGISQISAITLQPGENRGNLTVPLTDPATWSPERPQLYYVTMFLLDHERQTAGRSERFGYREFTVKDGLFHLNGKKIYLFGESLIVSDSLPEDYIIRQLTQMRQYGINCVRTAHQPAIPRFYEIADELGMMVNNEWGWSFNDQLDLTAFPRNNAEEIRKWVERDYNHPSVVIWSGGNEVTHRQKEIGEQLDKQVELIRSLDNSGRPVGSFSGSAALAAYGKDRRETDFLDLHDYTGTTRNGAWTLWPEMAAFRQQELEEVYGKDYLKRCPVIFWENIGLGWGWKSDPEFKLSDIRAYDRYATKTPTEWATPNGIGFAGCVGLATALSPDGKNYAQNLYGKRLGEMFRRDPQFNGVATGWFHNLQPGMTLWNQPVLVMLINQRQLPPRNLWSGKSVDLTLPVVNQSGSALPAGTLRIGIVGADGQPELTILTPAVPPVGDFEVQNLPISITIPADIDGQAQLRLTYLVNNQEVSRNFYDIFVQSPELTKTKLQTAKKIAVLDVGSPLDSENFAARLRELGLNPTVVGGKEPLANYQLAIIPPAKDNQKPLSFNRQGLFEWIAAGGSLLALEQQSANGSILESFRVIAPSSHYLLKIPNAMPFVDLIYPNHPVFAGLEQSNFDTWENPERGSVIEYQIAPFSLNSIAAKPPLLGELSCQSAIIEATYGKGQIFWSQLAADKLWSIDSAATRYLVNVLRYMTGNKRFDKITPLDLKSVASSFQTGEDAKLMMLNLKPFANCGFRDETANDGKGGWTDQGSNDMRNLPSGEQRAAGILFTVIDPVSNGDRGCIALKGEHNTNFAEAVTDIPVNRKFSRIFFLHTAGYLSGSSLAGRYVIHYQDGSKENFDMRSNKNIGDWWGCGFLPDAKLGLIVSNPVKDQVGSYVAEWVNPYPQKEITAIDILSSETARRQNIDWLPEPAPTTFVIAITGEEFNDFRLELDTANAPAKWHSGGNAQKDQPPAVATKLGENGPEGGQVTSLSFPEGSAESVPTALFWFKLPADFDPAAAAYLNCFVRSETPGEITVILPCDGWKNNYRVTLTLDGSGQWRRLRLPFPAAQRKQVTGKKMQGELWFQNNPAWLGKKTVPPVNFQISDIVLE